MTWEEFMSAVYIAIDTLRSGDSDEAEILREWSDLQENTTEGFQMILRRDVVARHGAEQMGEMLENLRKSVQGE